MIYGLPVVSRTHATRPGRLGHEAGRHKSGYQASLVGKLYSERRLGLTVEFIISNVSQEPDEKYPN